jgi:hypothetical protein
MKQKIDLFQKATQQPHALGEQVTLRQAAVGGDFVNHLWEQARELC